MEIRLATPADGAGCAAIYGPVVTSAATSFEVDPPDAAEMARRIEGTLQAYPWLVCVDNGRIAGYAYATRHRARAAYDWSVETTVYIHEDYRRRGIGRDLYAALFEILAEQGYANAYAGITLPNAGSVGLHEASGFEHIGVYRRIGYKFGKWHDVGWWQRSLRDPATGAGPIRSVAEVATFDPKT